jgi:N6-adenosine-specific RNA methylase IME4
MTLPFHPLAELFPLLEGDDFASLVNDVKANGLLEPIVIHEDKILDGRNRYRACLATGVEPNLVPFAGDDALAFVISANLHRRHLDESQRSIVAAKLAQLRPGDNQHSEGLPIGRASEMLNVGRRTVARAREVLDHGAPELRRAVERGEISISAAADVATRPIDEQREIVARGEKEILETAKAIRARRAESRRAERFDKLVILSNRNAPLVADHRFPIVYADPPWQYEHHLSASREIENHYPTLPIEKICALGVADICTPDAMLFLWVPAPLLLKGLQALEAWGFEYCTNMVWDKQSIGMGIYVRQQHEQLIIASRGAPITASPSTLPASVFSSPRGKHSEKPKVVYEFIERMYPDLPKIELFARSRRAGWGAWGNEVEQCDDLSIPPFLRRSTAMVQP